MNAKQERIAIIDGHRTPFCKAGGSLKSAQADDLGAYVIKELAIRLDYPVDKIDEVIMGNVSQPIHASNVARVAAIKGGIPPTVPAYTVHRNCASGMEAITTAANKILADQADVILAAATESMSNIPLIYNEKMTTFFAHLMKSKTLGQKLKTMASFRPAFLKPIIGLKMGLTDPTCGLIMGSTAEILARDFHITREEQDAFSLESHKRAAAAIRDGRLAEEIIPVSNAGKHTKMLSEDEGPRFDQTIEALTKLKPYFERKTGTVTVGNSSQVTDGAAATLLMKESKAKELGLEPLGYLRHYAYAGLEGKRMGLGPVYATSKLLRRSGINFKDFQLMEINEAFAAQVIGCVRAFASDDFAKKELGRDRAIGDIDSQILNVNGGAISLGHPVGATGIRIVITLLKELRRREQNLGLATLCIGGGQGAALALEVA